MGNGTVIILRSNSKSIGFNIGPSTDSEINCHAVSNRRIADPSPRGEIAIDSRAAGTGFYYKSKIANFHIATTSHSNNLVTIPEVHNVRQV